MTTHPQPHSRRVHVLRDLVRRSAAVLAAVLVIGGTPLVARALGDEFAPVATSDPEAAGAAQPERNRTERAVRPVASVPDVDAGIDADPATAEAPASHEPQDPVVTPEPAVDPVIAVLADRYEWDERGPRIVVLQEALGIAVDGSYGQHTHRAHRTALEFVGLPTDIVPAPVLPPGPAPSEWAALRECESNGNYAITNPSGKYRGAYQFDRSTWNSVAERHAPHLVDADPAAASPGDQDAMAFALYSERGARPWPHCGRHLS